MAVVVVASEEGATYNREARHGSSDDIIEYRLAAGAQEAKEGYCYIPSGY